MADKHSLDDLEAFYESELKDIPKQHPLRTPNCPPVPRFVTALTPADQAHAVGCPYCQKMLAIWNRMRLVLRFPNSGASADQPVVFVVPHPQGMAADTGTAEKLDLRTVAESGVIEAQFVEQRKQPRYVLEVCTKDATLKGRRVEYVMCGKDGSEAIRGTLELRQDSNAWYAAREVFPADQLFYQLHGQCSRFEVRLIDE